MLNEGEQFILQTHSSEGKLRVVYYQNRCYTQV